MDIKNCPPVVFVTMVVLSLTVLFGTTNAAYQFAMWHENLTSFPLQGGVMATVCGLLPMLAIIDIYRGRVSGRYLGSLSMMITWGFMLRPVGPGLFMSRRAFIETSTMVLPVFASVIAMAALIVSFGFGQKSNRYFVKDEKY